MEQPQNLSDAGNCYRAAFHSNNSSQGQIILSGRCWEAVEEVWGGGGGGDGGGWRGGKTQPFQFQLQLPPLPHWLFFTLCEFCMNPAALKFPSGAAAAAAHAALQIAALLFRVLLRDAEAN